MAKNYDGGNIRQLEDLNFYSLFNNKSFWEKWFTDSALDDSIKRKCRQVINEDVFSLNWRTMMGVTVDWKYIGHYWGSSPLVKDNGKFKSVFLDFRGSFLKEGFENTPSHYYVNVYNCYNRNTFPIPHYAIMNYWTAGWPRGGWYPGKYVTEPWALLKPTAEFLDGTLPYRKLLASTQCKKFRTQQSVFDFVYESIYPWIRMKKSLPAGQAVEWRDKLRKFYEQAVEINKTEFRQRYNPRNPYTGPVDGGFPFEWFDEPEKMKNPFLRFYRQLRNENADALRDAKSSFIKIDKLTYDSDKK